MNSLDNGYSGNILAREEKGLEMSELSAMRLTPRKVPWFAVISYVVLACGLAWAIALPLWLGGNGLRNPFAGLILPAMMFTPALAAMLVALFVQRPRPTPIAEYLGLWPLRPAKRTVWMSVIAIFGSAALIIIGVFLAAALGLVKLDLVNFSGFAALLRTKSPTPIPIPVGILVLIQILSIPVGALINGCVTIGEELGWRGWLLPTLRPLGTWPALLITGAVWGFWHSPIILLGYNFNQPNLYGAGLMIVGCVIYGVLIGWLRLRTASIWPSVFAHGAFNATAGFLGLVIDAHSRVNPVALNPLGWVTGIVMVLVIVLLVLTGQFKKQPSLDRRTAPPPVSRHVVATNQVEEGSEAPTDISISSDRPRAV